MRVKDYLKVQTCMVLGVVSLASTLLLNAGSAWGAEKAEKAEKEVKAFKSDPVVVFETTKGTIKAELYKDLAPKTVENFLMLVNKGFYNGLTFHRYEPGFCIQGGDPLGTGVGGSADKIPLEAHPKDPHTRHNAPGVLAMARTSDPDSASCQFYFALDKLPGLDSPPDGGPGYAVFGRTIVGLENVMRLRRGDKMTKVYVEK